MDCDEAYAAPCAPHRVAARRGEAMERRRLEQDHRHALATGGFAVHYQPRVMLADGAVVALEALLRLPNRRRGLMPAALVADAEHGRLGDAMAAWLLRAACQEAAAWAGAAPAISVNLPRGHLQDGSILHHLAAALEASGLDPERLQLELTESMLIEPGVDALLTLSAIRDLGVGLVVDDFGLALASLSSLRHLPLTGLKLDRSLVRDLARDEEDRAVVHSVARSARALHLRMVAEGVETEAQRDVLLDLGCEEAQGSLFSHPLPAQQVLGWLQAAMPATPRSRRRQAVVA